MTTSKPRLALVTGNVPNIDEIDQFRLLVDTYEVNVISSVSICEYLKENSFFNDLTCIALQDHDENPTFLPGLEQVLKNYDLVVVKGRLGLFAYQTIKAKWQSRFRLFVWVDNLVPFPANDIDQMRTIRQEVTNAADGFIVQSRHAKSVLEVEGIESDRITDMIPWVEQRAQRDGKSRAEARSSIGLAEGDIVIGYIGLLEWEEGLMNLAAAIKVAKLKDPGLARRLRVAISGIGSWSGQLRSHFVSMGIDDQVVFVPPSRKAQTAILNAVDAMYLSGYPAQDRVDGDPYRVLLPVTNGIPLLASRSPIVEEICGKHRLDFCIGSSESLYKALKKVQDATVLKNDIVHKNLQLVKSKYSKEAVSRNMKMIFEKFNQVIQASDDGSIDHLVVEIELRVKNKQYLAAVEIIENLFSQVDVPIHHEANLYRLMGDCFAKLSDNDAAKDAYIKAAELDPFSAKTYVGLGTLGLLKASHDISVIHFQKAVSLSPLDEMANLGLGLAFQGLNECNEAIKWVEKSIEVNRENTAALYTLVKLAYDVEQYDSAINALTYYYELHPNDHEMSYALGGLYFKIGNYNQVSVLMNRMIKVDPMDSRAHSLLRDAERGLEKKVSTSNA